MERYHLLRHNCESGPYCLDELTSLELRPKDLIWIEGESKCWSYPTEIDALRPFVREESESLPKRRPVIVNEGDLYISVRSSVPARSREELRKENHAYSLWPADGPLRPPFPGLKERIRTEQTKKNNRRKIFLPFMKIAAFFFGLVFGAMLIKRLVDSVVTENSAMQDSPAAVQRSQGGSDMSPDASWKEGAELKSRHFLKKRGIRSIGDRLK